MDFETMSVKELQDKLFELGVPADEAEGIKQKTALVTMVKNLMAKDAVNKEEPHNPQLRSIEELPNPSEDRETNKRWLTKADAMRKHLEKQEKVSIIIPLDPGEKMGVVETRTDKNGRPYQVHISGAIESVQLNGFKTLIPKGIYTQVPRQIAEVISHSQQQTLMAGREVAIDRLDAKTGRPISEML